MQVSAPGRAGVRGQDNRPVFVGAAVGGVGRRARRVVVVIFIDGEPAGAAAAGSHTVAATLVLRPRQEAQGDVGRGAAAEKRRRMPAAATAVLVFTATVQRHGTIAAVTGIVVRRCRPAAAGRQLGGRRVRVRGVVVVGRAGVAAARHLSEWRGRSRREQRAHTCDTGRDL
jgi:hypothetical protein